MCLEGIQKLNGRVCIVSANTIMLNHYAGEMWNDHAQKSEIIHI